MSHLHKVVRKRYVEIVTRILFFLTLLIQREYQYPSPTHIKSKSFPPVMTRQEYRKRKGSQRASRRAVSDYYNSMQYKIHSSK